MPVLLQHRIYRSDLKNNPNILYLFGDNEKREGRGGQAAECRGEPNAVGIRTKFSPSHAPGAFWTDLHFDEHFEMIMSDLKPVAKHIAKGGTVVVPSDGLGTGLAKLQQKAPKTFEALNELLKVLIEFDEFIQIGQ